MTPLTTSICPFRKRIFVDFLRKIYEWKMKNQWKVVTTFVDFLGFMVFKTTSRLTSFLSFWKQCTVAGRRLMANCCQSLNPKSPGGGQSSSTVWKLRFLQNRTQCLHFGPDFRTLVRIRTFLSKLVRIWSGFCWKVRIFHEIMERTHKIPHFGVCWLSNSLRKCAFKTMELTQSPD